MHSSNVVARLLASALLAGEWDIDQMVARAMASFGKRYRWLRPLMQRVCERFANHCPSQRVLADFLVSDPGFAKARKTYQLRIKSPIAQPPSMQRWGPAASWKLPAICTAAELAEWLGITLTELGWFADCRSLETKRVAQRQCHYHYRLLKKRFGRVRLIEAPKSRLKRIQRRLLDEILAKVPPHPATHGFRKGRSIMTFAAPHVGQRVVLKIDLEDFFPSIESRRVAALFRTMGYPDVVATLLTGLCTNSTPPGTWHELAADRTLADICEVQQRYTDVHLPQGAPTSPALANLCAYRLDCRLSGLASTVAATYTRYADDLVFSGDGQFERCALRFRNHVYATAMEEGFRIHTRKTRVMRQGVRQYVAGLVVNQHLNLCRADVDRLKATLTNCIRHGPDSQNRANMVDFRAHLEGKVSFIQLVNPARGRKLRSLLDKINW